VVMYHMLVQLYVSPSACHD